MISVIIPAWNYNKVLCDHTLRCVDSIACSNKYYPVELVLIDNGSAGFERKRVTDWLNVNQDKFTSLKYLRLNNNLGFIKAINLGIDCCEGEHICFQNNDTIVSQKTYLNMVRSQKETQAWAVGPMALIPTLPGENPMRKSWQAIDRVRKLWNTGVASIPPFVHGKTNLDTFNEILSKSNVRGMYPHMIAFFCTVFPKSTIDRIGYLDEIYGCGLADDDDYCRRIIMMGGKIYFDPKVAIIHNHRSSFKIRAKELGISYHKESAVNLAIYKQRWRNM